MTMRKVLVYQLLLLAAGLLGAEENGSPGDIHGYAGAWVRNVTVLGEFTGDIYLSDGYQLLSVPEVGESWGFGGLIGMRGRAFALEASYARSSHSGLWGGSVLLQSRLQAYSASIRWYVFRMSIFEPFALCGCTFYDLTVFDGATDGSTERDETFHGIGWDLGGGLRIALGKRLSLVAQAAYHWARMNTVDDFDGFNVTIADGLDAGGFDYGALVMVSF
jgi:hypothetical protein